MSATQLFLTFPPLFSLLYMFHTSSLHSTPLTFAHGISGKAALSEPAEGQDDKLPEVVLCSKSVPAIIPS
jgi:hypothetical protein